ncbi:hypothetical protein AB0I02_27925 [Streptomyces phaeochromogenes]
MYLEEFPHPARLPACPPARLPVRPLVDGRRGYVATYCGIVAINLPT